MQILDAWAAEELLEQKEFIRDLLLVLAGDSVANRQARDEAAALEVNRRIDRVRVHLDAPGHVDLRAVREHLEAAIEAIEATR